MPRSGEPRKSKPGLFKSLHQFVRSQWSHSAYLQNLPYEYQYHLHLLTTSFPSLKWDSKFLNIKNKISKKRLSEILDLVLENRDFQNELLQFCREKKKSFWTLYFKRCYNAVAGFSSGYIDLLCMASRDLPKSGLILDVGAGTGNFTAGLLYSAPDRGVMAIDKNRQALNVAQKLLESMEISPKRYRIYSKDFTTGKFHYFQADGAVINNVFYTLSGRFQKRLFLKKLNFLLKKGSTVVLNDPMPQLGKTPYFREHVLQVALSALRNESPMNEFDLAFYFFINHQYLIRSRFHEKKELVQFAKTCGFELVKPPAMTFHGADNYYVLRKVQEK